MSKIQNWRGTQDGK
jgi:hypothetical protein